MSEVVIHHRLEREFTESAVDLPWAEALLVQKDLHPQDGFRVIRHAASIL